MSSVKRSARCTVIDASIISRRCRLDPSTGIFLSRNQSELLQLVQSCPNGVVAGVVEPTQFQLTGQNAAYWMMFRNDDFGY